MESAKDRSIYYMGIRKHLLRQSNVCALCGKEFKLAKEVTIDHIVPLFRGGSDHISNLQLAHEHCNRDKGNKEPGGARE